VFDKNSICLSIVSKIKQVYCATILAECGTLGNGTPEMLYFFQAVYDI